MDIAEGIAIIILILAILCLVYYYLQNMDSFKSKGDIKSFFASPRNDSEKDSSKTSIKIDDADEGESEDGAEDKDEEKVSTVDKIKISFKDIDMAAALNTDAFSKRLDAFLDEKSEELIESWALATTDDLTSLEERCELACNNIDDLEKRFSEYASATDSKLEDIEKRLKALEDEE